VHLEGPARRIAIATAATVVLFVAALGIASWRYQVALDRYDEAVLREDGAATGRDALIAVWRQQGELAQFAATGDSDHFRDFEAPSARVREALSRLRALAHDEILDPKIDAVLRDEREFVAAARARRSAIAKGDLGDLTDEGLVGTVLTDLRDVVKDQEDDADAAVSSAQSANDQALVFGLVAGALAVLMACMLGWYTVRLVGRLIRRIRSTARQLAQSSYELRAASEEVAAATSEQSAAVAQT
jgi:hypothetical protein